MKIVEYAIKIRDMGSQQLTSFGRKVTEQNAKARDYATNVQQLNKFYRLSYTELQQKIRDTENVIRNSVLKSEIREARRELAKLQKQSMRHKGNTATVGEGRSGSGGGGLSLGGLIKGNIATSGILKTVAAVRNLAEESKQAYIIQEMAEQKLSVIMRQRMGATNDQIEAVKQLASQQQGIGVIGDEVQLAGGQQLGTFLNKTESLKTLLPAMNNLLAQQRGLNATDQDAVAIGNMMGKVMQGQTEALRRVGVTFSEAEEKTLKYGNEQQRAAMLAQVITNNVGEMNAALAKTDLGKLKQDENMIGDIKEKYGAVITKLQVAFLPLAGIGVRLSESLLPVINGMIPAIQSGILTVVDIINNAKPYLMEMVQPAVALWEQLKGAASGLNDYIQIAGELVKEHIWPVVSRVWTAVTRIVGNIITWVSKSQLIKDIFNGVCKFVGGIADFIGEIIKGLEWVWDNVIMPILDAVEKVYQLIKGGGEIKITVKNGKKETTVKAGASNGNKPPLSDNALNELSKNIADNNSAAKRSESAITGGNQQRNVTFNISKFFDNINIHAASVTESTSDIEATVLQCLARVLNQGALSVTQ